MKIKQSINTDVTPDQIAECLSACTPEDFSNVFFALAERKRDDHQWISDVGREMAQIQGGIRKNLFKGIYKAICFFETKLFISEKKIILNEQKDDSE